VKAFRIHTRRHYDGKTVRFAFRDYAEGGKTSYKILPVLAFIGRLIRHIPDKPFKMGSCFCASPKLMSMAC
jgi:hypothetical protein